MSASHSVCQPKETPTHPPPPPPFPEGVIKNVQMQKAGDPHARKKTIWGGVGVFWGGAFSEV